MATILDHDSSLHAIMIVGDFGSGKTEVAVNLSLRLKSEDPGRSIAIADLDLVNPYFRCREAHAPLEQAGIRVVMPDQDGHQYADLPILVPQVKGLLQDRQTLSVLDVGGDEAGSRVLAAMSGAFSPERHGFWFVVNARRPFNDTPEGCLKTIRGIEETTGLSVTGLISNTHLMTLTTPGMVLEGVELTEQVAAAQGAPVRLVAIMDEVASQMDTGAIEHPLLIMRRIMVPPWLHRGPGGADKAAQRLGSA